MNNRKQDILAQIAVWYYEDNMSQGEIGKLIGKSRSMVSRMLNDVRESGLIEVKVKYPLKRNYQLEKEAKEKFGLKDIRILNSENLVNQDMISKMVGKLSGNCVVEYLKPDIKIGLGWSRTIYSTLKNIPESKIANSEVVQLSGSVLIDSPEYDGIDMTRKLAKKIDADYYYFPAPMVVSTREMKERMMDEVPIKVAMQKASQVDLAIVGIGNVLKQNSGLMDGGLIDQLSLKELEGKQPAGDILGNQIDLDGNIIGVELNKRVIGLQLEELKKIKYVIAVSTGPEKIIPIHAAIKGKWINILVSDDKTIEAVLSMAG